ncbi:hypothetical protein WMY93_020890 [Mugilogobius chulae]|uniref:N-terminal Ras-GEF domain-containing protein n=1 Tax=Mugilogobius chulae TaxID=88201 RepID=A0AAW0NAB1_9GOBI
MPPTTPYAGKFNSCGPYTGSSNNNHHQQPQPHSPYRYVTSNHNHHNHQPQPHSPYRYVTSNHNHHNHQPQPHSPYRYVTSNHNHHNHQPQPHSPYRYVTSNHTTTTTSRSHTARTGTSASLQHTGLLRGRSNTAPKPSTKTQDIYNCAYVSTENPYDIPHTSYRSSSLTTVNNQHHHHNGCVSPRSPRQQNGGSTSCHGRGSYRSSSSGSEQSCHNGQAPPKSRAAPYGHGGVIASYGEMCYHDNSLVSASLEALIQHLVPTVDYYPDRSYVFTFLLSSRLFLPPFDLMTRVCHLCVEQQRSGDALLDKIRFREVAPKLVQLLTEWTETFPYDFRDERMMRCLKDMSGHVSRGDEYSWRAMQQMTQRLIKRLSALGQYEEAVAALNNVAQERPASLKSKQAAGQRSDVLSVCDDAFVLAQQLTHIELDRLSFIGPEEFIQTFAMKDPLENQKGFFANAKPTTWRPT